MVFFPRRPSSPFSRLPLRLTIVVLLPCHDDHRPVLQAKVWCFAKDVPLSGGRTPLSSFAQASLRQPFARSLYPPKHCPTPCYDGHHYGYLYAHPVYHGTYVKAPDCKPTPCDKPCDKPSKRKCVRHHYHTHEYGYGPSVYYPSFWFGGHGHHHGHGYQDNHHHGHHSHHGHHTGHHGHHDYHTAHHGHSPSYGQGWPYYEY